MPLSPQPPADRELTYPLQAEIQRSALRTIYQLSKLSTPAGSPKFEELVATVRSGEYRVRCPTFRNCVPVCLSDLLADARLPRVMF